jgi:glycosyltransferase involved in cell wall biosynthesis
MIRRVVNETKESPYRLLIETTALTRPGQERGLGRYANACLAGAHAMGCEVTELRVRNRSGRTAEFIDLAERSVTALSHKRDIFHVTHPGVWGPSRSPTVVSILDLIPLDLQGYSQTGIKSRFFLSRAAHARVVLTISNFTADRIVQRLKVDPDRVIVAPLFPVAAFHAGSAGPPPLELPDAYVLAVTDMATSDPRKRPGWIAPLARDLKRAGLNMVIAGAGTDKRSAGLGEAVGLGRVSDERLAQLAHHSVCFLYFSAYEGQGLPPLEAMAAGAAVIATANTATTEIVGDAGILVDEGPGSWADALLENTAAEATRGRLVDACVSVSRDESLRTELQARGRKRAALFSEDRFFGSLASAYRRASCA